MAVATQGPGPVGDLLAALTSSPHALLQPSAALHASSLAFLKQTLDPVAHSVSDVQTARLQDARKKRKRGDHLDQSDVLRLKKVHVDGFAIDQVWEQARRVIDAARSEAEKGLETLRETYAASDDESDHVSEPGSASELGEEGVDYVVEGEDDDQEEYHTSEDESDEQADLENDDEEDVDMASGDDQDQDGEEEEEQDDDDDDDDDDEENDEAQEPEAATEYIPDPHGLNDGFFSIDDFNRQSDFLEQADARGDNNDALSDEEDIDWGTNPLSTAANNSKSKRDQDGDMEDEDDQEEGATFGDADLNAPFSDDEDADDQSEVAEGELDDMAGLSNTNAIKYAEFFAPPAQKARKNKKGRPNPHNFPAPDPAAAKDNAENEDDLQRTMEAVHRDLFDESDAGEDDDAEELDPADPRSRRSTHERRRAEIEKEIRKLEAANVAKREWTLSGEARAADRPMNSLLEEDLDFERAGKPVPVITAEVSESIEELIKRRILAHDFQDIIRRRPDDLATGRDARRGRFELDDSKSKKSLAEMYEEEHLKKTDPDYVDAQDEQTQKQQKEIEGLWKDIVHKLDSLSSFHFKPGPRAAQLDIRVDAPVVRLEDARPTAGADAAGASQLAPQELYKAGEAVDRRSDEVATRGGLPVAREEMSREERKRRRRRDKEREKKAGTNVDAAGAGKPESKKSRERKDIIGDLKRGNVKVIGKKGLTDVEGQAVKGPAGATSAGRYKL